MVKVYLSRKGIPFAERNISTDTQAKEALLAMGYRTTPITVINGEKIVGYNPARLEAALKAAPPK